MGCDGGSKVDRRDIIVKVKKNKKTVDKAILQNLYWNNCKLSKKKLQEPIVACKLGYLYNKEEIINAMLDKTLSKKLPHIKSLKDLVECKFTPNPEHQKNPERSRFICPCSQKELQGNSKFILLKSCGHVVSQSAFDEIKSDNCLVCSKKFSKKKHIIILNWSEDSLKKKLKKRKLEENDEPLTKNKKKKMAVKDTEKTVPKLATKEIWSSIFYDEKEITNEDPNSFLNRPGMRGPLLK